MNIRTAKETDLKAMMELIAQASARIKTEGFDQWQNGYPDEQTVLADINDKNAYVAEEEGEIAGMMCLSFTDSPSYEKIDGKWIDDGFYCSVHRMCVADKFIKKGIATSLFAAAEMISREMGYASVRVDTHKDNSAMKKTLENCGYTHCGVIKLVGTVEDGHEREAYQKIVK